jgi:hypothetical protein
VIRLQDSAIEPATTTGNGYIGNRLLILLGVDKIFGEEEIGFSDNLNVKPSLPAKAERVFVISLG